MLEIGIVENLRVNVSALNPTVRTKMKNPYVMVPLRREGAGIQSKNGKLPRICSAAVQTDVGSVHSTGGLLMETQVHGTMTNVPYTIQAHQLQLAETVITSDLYQSFQKCLDLRDKYMVKSRQRLGDNPRDHDGRFPGLDDKIADVHGARPDADFRKNDPPPSPFDAWKIYPSPPPPHWHWTDKEKVVSGERNSARGSDEFVFEDCSIPGLHPWHFEIDDKGVFQVYEKSEGGPSSIRIR